MDALQGNKKHYHRLCAPVPYVLYISELMVAERTAPDSCITMAKYLDTAL